MAGDDLYRVVVNSITANIAILDDDGVIVETNEAWRRYARSNGMPAAYDSVGVNYLSVCQAASAQDDNEAGRVAEGIRRVMAGEIAEFFMQYPCHSPEEKRWYAVRVVPYRDTRVHRVIVTHENITPIMAAQEELERKEAELRRQAERLEDTNIALKVLLRQREEDRRHIEATVLANAERLVLPYVERLLQLNLSEKQRTLVEIIDTNIREITAPFLKSLSNLAVKLTPQEIEVAGMVRQGRSSKEIADLLNLSVPGVDFHRKSLRRKLGLTHSARNLRSYLLSLE